jgi:hypothetical protein
MPGLWISSINLTLKTDTIYGLQKHPNKLQKFLLETLKRKWWEITKVTPLITPGRRSNVEENVFGSASFLTVITGIKESCSETNLES